jgi:tetratricopeptide (TPR) repeat protein
VSELDVIGTLSGTDKSSVHGHSWDYLRHYEQLISKWKSDSINIIEIGVRGGNSTEMWLRYFEKATIIGVDINPECRHLEKDRVIIKIGSQEDPAFLQSIISEFKPTIVIDDGSHIAHHMIAAFEVLFPALAPGGIYIFEDCSFHFPDGAPQWRGAKAHQGASEKSIFDYLSPFVRARLANTNCPEGAWGFSRYAFENIDSVTVFGGALAFQKRGDKSFDKDIAIFEAMLTDNGAPPIEQIRYAMFLIKHDVHIDRAYELLVNLQKAEPFNITVLEQIYMAARRLNKNTEALDFAEQIKQKMPDAVSSWSRIAQVQRVLHRPKLELAALQRTLELDDSLIEIHRRVSVLQEQSGNIAAALAAAQKVYNMAPNKNEANRRLKILEAKIAKQ